MERVHAHPPHALTCAGQLRIDDLLYFDGWLEARESGNAELFFAGISLRLDWRPSQIAVLCMAGAMLLGGGAFVLSLPFA